MESLYFFERLYRFVLKSKRVIYSGIYLLILEVFQLVIVAIHLIVRVGNRYVFNVIKTRFLLLATVFFHPDKIDTFPFGIVNRSVTVIAFLRLVLCIVNQLLQFNILEEWIVFWGNDLLTNRIIERYIHIPFFGQ